MTLQKTCLSVCLLSSILVAGGCGSGGAPESKSTAAPARAPIMANRKGAVNDRDGYWNPGLMIAQQHDEAQVTALLLMILASPPSRDDFFGKPGDPSSFSSTDGLLQRLYKADASHKIYTKVRDFMLMDSNADTYKAYGDDFRKKMFIPLSKSVLGFKADENPYPDNICPTAATTCDGSDGLGLTCAIQ